MEYTRRGSRSSPLGCVETAGSAVDEEPGKCDGQGAAVSEPQGQEEPREEGATTLVARGQQFISTCETE